MKQGRTHAARRLVAQFLVATTALLALPAIAAAEGGTPVIGLEIRAVDQNTRVVNAVLHCVAPEKAGKLAMFNVAPGVDMSALAPGQMVGAKVDTSAAPPAIVELAPVPCDAKPQGNQPQPGQPGGPGQQPGGPGKPGPGGPGQPGSGPQGDDGGDFAPSFLSRVWKFVGEVDGYEGGKLSMTIGKVLNLPKKFRDQDDELVDEDAIVLVSKARVIDEDGERVAKSALEDAEDVRVQGKLLPEAKWEKDEDDQPVATIRAKKVYILG
ncbi:MAG: hypothetical protein ACEQSX_06495 [Baekduiaceae bacterium]